ncbi:WD40 repeat domain-containing protein [Streptomyces sp. NPDC058171]
MRSFSSVAGAACLAVLTTVLTAGPVSAAGPASAGDVGAEGFTIEDPRIKESSGLAASRQHPGIYWTHNDSDDGAFLYAVDARSGKTVATLTLTGVGRPRDVEAISLGPDGNLYVGDIGDNLGGTWNHVWVYKVPEPKKLVDRTVKATQYVVKYADGPRDAEALMVHPKTGRVYITDKKDDGATLYAGPAKLSPSGTNVFRRVSDIDLWVTDGAFSPDGRQLALRGYLGGVLYDWKGDKPKRVDRLRIPLQRQGESLTWTPDGKTLLYGSEGLGSDVEPRKAPGGSGGGRDGDGSDGSDGSAAGDGGEGDGGGFTQGTALLVVLLVAVFGVRRLRRGKG